MKIYNLLPYYNEKELLMLRLWELWEIVDYFVIGEADRSHTGIPKPFYFDEVKDEFSDYMKKIIHLKINNLPDVYLNPNFWIPENTQRNCLAQGLKDAQKGDFIICSDADEIPRPQSILDNLHHKKNVTFQSDLFYYTVNIKANQKWDAPTGAFLGNFKCLQDLRENRSNRETNVIIPDAGWHYSFCGGVDRIMKKVQNIAESHLIIDKIGTKEDIQDKINTQKDLWNRTEDYAKKQLVELDETSPKNIQKFIKLFPEFYYDKSRKE